MNKSALQQVRDAQLTDGVLGRGVRSEADRRMETPKRDNSGEVSMVGLWETHTLTSYAGGDFGVFGGREEKAGEIYWEMSNRHQARCWMVTKQLCTSVCMHAVRREPVEVD